MVVVVVVELYGARGWDTDAFFMASSAVVPELLLP